MRRRPLAVEYRGHEFRSNPPPSAGGLLVGLGLRVLGEREPTAEAIAEAMEAQEAARGGGFVRALHHGGLAQKLLSGTTHISVVDAEGSAASLSASLGSGSGVVVPGTGIHLNNMLGEADLVTGARPGERLTSMMAPSIVLRGGDAAPGRGLGRLSAPARRDPAGRRERRRPRDGRRGSGRRAADPRRGGRRALRRCRGGGSSRVGGPRSRALPAAEPVLRRRERSRGAARTARWPRRATRAEAERAW